MTDQDKNLKPDNDKKDSEKKQKSEDRKSFSSIIQQAKVKKIAQREEINKRINQEIVSSLPSNQFALPVIPLKQGLLFPHTESVLTFGRDFSVAAIKDAAKNQKLVVLVSQKRTNLNNPQTSDLYKIGVLAVIERTLKTENNLSALVKGIARVEIVEYLQEKPYFKAQVTKLEDIISGDQEEIALASHLKQTFQKIVQMGKPVEFLNFIKLMSGSNSGEMSDQISIMLNLKTNKKQELLETLDVKQRMKLVLTYLNHEANILEIEKDVASKTQQKFDKHMRESVLRERLNTIKKELGEYEDSEDTARTFRDKLKKASFSKNIKDKIKKEIDRLESMSPNNPETGYISSWLETVFDLPWESDKGKISLSKAEKILNKSHYGLEDVKERILEYIAVLQLKNTQKSTGKKKPKKNGLPTILCFVGPPGVGKTSLGQAIADALERKFVKVSLGGIRDEAEIRGHRRTYIGAMPGRIIKGIISAKSKNPVFILDEIDKVGKDFRGDPSAALLEVLDPEQNHRFEDHYLDLEYDLSEVIFITTANALDTIPPALRDRLEIINYSGYTYNEKFNIAKQHLVEKTVEANALPNNQVEFSDLSIKTIIQRYTREAGVRELERKLGKVTRKIAKKIVINKKKNSKPIKITPKTIRELLGPEEYDTTLAEEKSQVGIATGLAWTPVGGDILFIEVVLTPGKEKVVLTGKLGEVMQESAQAALTFVKSHSKELKIDSKQFENTNVHIHVPEGAVPKDGPSAGIALATAITSAFTNKPIPRNIAMTGEITLRGKVMRIGGLKEKTIAAHLAGISKVLIPKDNERDLEELPAEVKKDIEFIPVANASEVLKLVFK